MTCNVFWGSHGCDLEEGHEGLHHCLSCCEPENDSHMAAHAAADGKEYGVEGCAGLWPYYGRHNMTGEGNLKFFTLSDSPDWTMTYLPDEFDRMAALR